MNAGPPLSPLPEHRIRAKRLLKQLKRPDDEGSAREAASRFLRLASFRGASVEQVMDTSHAVKLKHALAVIALENGHDSWRALKRSVEAGERASGVTRPPYDRETYDPRMDVFLNRWFARYEEARASLEREGGFLLPYGRQFFVCEEGAVRTLGLDPEDPDWERIGRDWAEPEDTEAWLRLREKREMAAR